MGTGLPHGEDVKIMNGIKKNQTVKGALALLCALMMTVSILSIVAASVIGSLGVYREPYEYFRRNLQQTAINHEIQTIWQIPMKDYSEFANLVSEYNLGVDVELTRWDYFDHHGPEDFHEMDVISSSRKDDASYEEPFDLYLVGDEDRDFCARIYPYSVTKDGSLLYELDLVTKLAYDNRYIVVALAAVAGIISLVLLVLLMIAAGHRKEDDEIHSHWIDRGLWDLQAFLAASLIGILAAVSVELTFMDYRFGIVTTISSVFISSLAVIICAMSLAVQCKTGVILKRSLVGICLITAYRVLRWALEKFINAWNQLTASMPRTWKAFLLLGVILAVALIGIMCGSALLLILEFIIVVPIICYLIVNADKMDKLTESIAKGEFGQRINPKNLFGASRKRAENLNSIDEAVSRAVEERMKSEHFKTELITNVSHDIKTPLTSIISYSELLKQHNEELGDAGDATSAEYIDVIYENALRLKKLTSDIVEASKASSGAIEVEITDIDLGMLVNQCLCEYQEKLEKAGLETICNVEEGLTISADGKLMWRVIDNLLSNVCKYSAAGSRVYIDARRAEAGDAEAVIRNISDTQLNISADELMERFVRGDASRNTEGSGLGLSIARSLAELQGGTLDISIDGDLFKVTLKL